MSREDFINNFATIALEAPELREDFIHKSFVHVGESVTQKNIWSGLRAVLEMDDILYHAVAHSEDNKSIYIVSKQRASQVRDENTRNKTGIGEKPKLAEYLVMMQLLVQPTTFKSHGHTLGLILHVMQL